MRTSAPTLSSPLARWGASSARRSSRRPAPGKAPRHAGSRGRPQLLEIPGCAALTAATIVGEVAGVSRFKSEAAFACHAGLAPIPVWSGNTAGQVRLSRSGNRQLNAAIHRIAVTQIRMEGSAGHTCYQRLIAAGKTKAAARRGPMCCCR